MVNLFSRFHACKAVWHVHIHARATRKGTKALGGVPIFALPLRTVFNSGKSSFLANGAGLGGVFQEVVGSHQALLAVLLASEFLT